MIYLYNSIDDTHKYFVGKLFFVEYVWLKLRSERFSYKNIYKENLRRVPSLPIFHNTHFNLFLIYVHSWIDNATL